MNLKEYVVVGGPFIIKHHSEDVRIVIPDARVLPPPRDANVTSNVLYRHVYIVQK